MPLLTHHERIRLLRGEEIALGPGKADLLDAIVETGSISGAARHIGMSYRRAWLLVETMNACFERPLVAAVKGGSGGGGARITDSGRELLDRYRALERDVAKLIEPRLADFESCLRKTNRIRGGSRR